MSTAKTSWPEVVGWPAAQAVTQINTDRPHVAIEVPPSGTSVAPGFSSKQSPRLLRRDWQRRGHSNGRLGPRRHLARSTLSVGTSLKESFDVILICVEALAT